MFAIRKFKMRIKQVLDMHNKGHYKGHNMIHAGSWCLTIVLMLCLVKNGTCQVHYQKGYVVNNDGDTLWGFIDISGKTPSPEQVRFREDITSSKSIVYTVSDLKSFGAPANHKKYTRGVLKMIMPKSDGRARHIHVDTAYRRIVFFEDLVRGNKLNLYEYKADNAKPYFFIADHDAPEDFIQLVYWVITCFDNGEVVSDRPWGDDRLSGDMEGVPALAQEGQPIVYYGYRQTLAHYIIDPASVLGRQLARAQYSEADLSAIVSLINVWYDRLKDLAFDINRRNGYGYHF